MASAITFSAVRPAAVARVAMRKPNAVAMKAVVLKQNRTRFSVVAMSKPDLSDDISKAIDDAKDACEGGTSGECAAAWDNVEELSAEASHQKAKEVKKDPLEEFCEGAPDADECRVYED